MPSMPNLAMNETHYLGCLWRLSSYAVLRPIWSWEEDAYNVYFEAVVWTWGGEGVCHAMLSN